MEDEEDDFYDPTDSVPTDQVQQNAYLAAPGQAHDGNEEEEEEEEEEIEVEDDDDDFNIITETPADAPPPEVSHPRHVTLRQEPQRPSSADSSVVSKSATPITTPHLDVPTPVSASAAPPAARPTVPQKPGSSYPAIHTSTIDINGNPVHPTSGKPIMSSDMDNDFPTDDKPWRRPGSDISDYFNYGFDEFTWASYCLKQQEVRKDVGDQKKQMDEMQSFLGMGMPGMPSAPAGPGAPGNAPQAMPGMPGMPDMSPDMMQGMLAAMMAQGLDPSSMDPMSFMQHAQSMMGGQPGAAPQGQPAFAPQGQAQGFGQGGQGQMGYGGYEQRGNYGGGRGRGRRW
ncbi:Pre-mRNA polyadenylation factor fip1 [Penicillium macrosclerotiorum]|uniref:Pre-mRNA polyadenylation factor fip1 n=1 Tax=Penicillium macrosclerotiorum TaxID=303699 RepID=UPI00254698C0|nr:Pre-mRNA polyadenylation factor fip1 [Penicillium macrosclerotiorum]KAJ5690776.1 Pre-mRNA polyadenylation factor fip1 [Penicillium macrosclerotiorum]